MRPQMRPCARLPQTDMINAPTSVWDSIVCVGSDREKESEQLKREHRWRASHYSNASSTERAVLSQCCCGAIVKKQIQQLEWNRPRLQPTQPKPSAQDEKHPLLSSDQKMFRLVLFNMSQWLSSELSQNVLGRFSQSYEQGRTGSKKTALHNYSTNSAISHNIAAILSHLWQITSQNPWWQKQ